MILVTGATGNVGRPLIDALHRAGASSRAITRNRGSANLPAQVEVIEGDPSHPETMAEALKGVTSMFFNPMAVQSASLTQNGQQIVWQLKIMLLVLPFCMVCPLTSQSRARPCGSP